MATSISTTQPLVSQCGKSSRVRDTPESNPVGFAEEALSHLTPSFDALVAIIDRVHAFKATTLESVYRTAVAEFARSALGWKVRMKREGVRCLTYYPGDLTSFLGPANAVASSILAHVAHLVIQHSATFFG
jgi:hypothetical protein